MPYFEKLTSLTQTDAARHQLDKAIVLFISEKGVPQAPVTVLEFIYAAAKVSDHVVTAKDLIVFDGF